MEEYSASRHTMEILELAIQHDLLHTLSPPQMVDVSDRFNSNRSTSDAIAGNAINDGEVTQANVQSASDIKERDVVGAEETKPQV